MQDLVSRVLELSREFQEKKINLKNVKLTQSSKYNVQTTDDVLEILGVMEHEFPNTAESLPDLDSEERILYALALQAKSLKPLDILCLIGDPPNEVFYVLDGKIGVTNLKQRVLTPELIEGKIFHTIGRGATLGEAGILFNSNRTMTLLAAEDSNILTIKKEPFMKTVGESQKKVNTSRIEMIQRIPPFINWTSAELASLFKLFIKVVPKYHSFIYEQGSKDEFLYLILKGEIELLVEDKAEPPAKTKDNKLLLNNRLPKKLPRVIHRLSIGSYFGDEEGFEPEYKSCSARANDFDCLLLKISKKTIRQNIMYKTDLQNDIKRAESMKMRIFQEKIEHLRALSENMDSVAVNIKPSAKIQPVTATIPQPKPVPLMPQARMIAAVRTLAEEQVVDDFKVGILHVSDSQTIAQKLKKANVEIHGIISEAEVGETKDTQIDRFQKDFADSVMTDKQRLRLQKKAQFAELLLHNQSKISSAQEAHVDSFLTNTRDEDETRRLDVSVSHSVIDRNPLADPKLRFLKKALQVSKSAMNLHLKSEASQGNIFEGPDNSAKDHSASLLPALKIGQGSSSKKWLVVKSERFNSNEPKRKETSLFQKAHGGPKPVSDVFIEGSQFKVPVASAAALPGKIGGFKRVIAGSKESVEGRGSARIIELESFLNKNLGVGFIGAKNHFRHDLSNTKDRKALSFRSIPTELNDSHIEADLLNRGVRQKIGNSVLLDPVMPQIIGSQKSVVAGLPKHHSRKPFLIKQASAQDVLFSRP